MKHHRTITKKPSLSQTNFEAWKDFLLNLLDQAIEAIFIWTS